MFQIMWKKITNLADAYRMSVEESEALKLENSSLKKELADASTSDVYRSCKEESDALKVENFRLKKELGEAYIRHLQP
jgi:regulator of replication initiation timing